jgi:hypothetical protein
LGGEIRTRCPFGEDCGDDCALYCPSDLDENIGTCAIFEIHNELASISALMESIYKEFSQNLAKRRE